MMMSSTSAFTRALTRILTKIPVRLRWAIRFGFVGITLATPAWVVLLPALRAHTFPTGWAISDAYLALDGEKVWDMLILLAATLFPTDDIHAEPWDGTDRRGEPETLDEEKRRLATPARVP